MKRRIYILAIGLGLFAVSCQKQEIVPISHDRLVMPVWENTADENARGASDDANMDDAQAMDGDSQGAGHGVIQDGGTGVDGGVGITDPNNPTEGSGNNGKGRK